MFKKIAVIGPGLLGGSLCKCVKKNDASVKVSAYGRSLERLRPAADDGSVDFIDTIENMSLSDCDLVVVATPAEISTTIIREVLSRRDLGKQAIVIDVGSVKGEIISSIAEHDRGDRFIGCHPMAGSEQMGFQHSRSDLYDNASVIITPHENNSRDDLEKISSFWTQCGARVSYCTPGEHDIIVAYTSHMPHVLAAAVVQVFDDLRRVEGSSNDLEYFIGNGFRDMTRISSGSPDMWHDIVVLNGENIDRAISKVIDELQRFRDLVSQKRQDEIHEYFFRIKKIRDLIR